jgi:hypothetical protein
VTRAAPDGYTLFLAVDTNLCVVTWANAMLWAPMRVQKIAEPIAGFGKLLASAPVKPSRAADAAPASPLRRTG